MEKEGMTHDAAVLLVGALIALAGVGVYNVLSPGDQHSAYEIPYAIDTIESVEFTYYSISFDAPADGELTLYDGGELIKAYFGNEMTYMETYHFKAGYNELVFAIEGEEKDLTAKIV